MTHQDVKAVGRKRELSFNGDRVSGGEDEKVLKMDSGDRCTVGMYLMPLNCTLRNG